MGVLTIVQSKIKANNATDGTTMHLTLGAAPTNGNLLVAIGIYNSGNGDPPTANTGWTVRQTANSIEFIATKVAGAGESATQQPFTNGENFWGFGIWEISGSAGWATDFVAWHNNAGAIGTTSYSVTSFNTANANELVLGMFAADNGSADGKRQSLSGTGGAGTTDGEDEGILGGVDWDILGVHWIVGSSGTTFNQTVAITHSSNGFYAIVELQSASSASTETSVGVMSFSGIAFAAVTAREETAAGALAFQGINYTSALAVAHSSVGLMSMAGIAITAAAIDLGAAGTGAVHFATFGA